MEIKHASGEVRPERTRCTTGLRSDRIYLENSRDGDTLYGLLIEKRESRTIRKRGALKKGGRDGSQSRLWTGLSLKKIQRAKVVKAG